MKYDSLPSFCENAEKEQAKRNLEKSGSKYVEDFAKLNELCRSDRTRRLVMSYHSQLSSDTSPYR